MIDDDVERGRRTTVRIPAALRAQLSEVADRRGHNASTLAFHWLWRAVAYADAGEFLMLPSKGSVEPESAGANRNLRFLQSVEDAAECARALSEAGSSVRAVLIRCAQAYVDAGGDLRAMRWPVRAGFVNGAA